MNKLYLYLPYVIILDAMAFLFYKHFEPNNIKTLLIPILGILLIYCYFKFHRSIDRMITLKINQILSKDRLNYINDYKIPSVIIYRVKKNYDCTSEQVEVAQAELKRLFKNHLNDLVNNSTEVTNTILNSALAFEIWSEFSLSGSLYHQFCNKAFGSYLSFNKSKVEIPVKLNKQFFPHLSNNHLITS